MCRDTRVVSYVAVALLVATMSFTTASDYYRCPELLPKNKYLITFANHCYRFVNIEEYWPDAQRQCQEHGGNLVAITTRGIQQFIMRSLKKLNWDRNGVWIGATDLGSEMSWRWINVGQMSEYHYSNWAEGQPSCHPLFCKEHCGLLRLSDEGLWHDYQCESGSYHYSYICKYKMEAPSTTTTTTTTPTTTTTATTTTSEARDNSTDIRPRGLDPDFIPPGQDRQTGTKVEDSSDTGIIVGPIMAVIGAILIIGAIIFFVMRRRRNKSSRDQSLEDIGHSNPGYGESGLPVSSPGSRPVTYTRESETMSLPPDFNSQVSFLSQASSLESRGAVGGPLPVPPTPTYKGKSLSDSDVSDSDDDAAAGDNEMNVKMYARIPADAAEKGKANVSAECRPQDGASASGTVADNIYTPMGGKGKAKKPPSQSPPPFRK